MQSQAVTLKNKACKITLKKEEDENKKCNSYTLFFKKEVQDYNAGGCTLASSKKTY